MIKIEAIVTDHIRSAMTDTHAYGGFTAFDATVVTVLSPENMKGERLTFYHEQNTPQDAALKDVSSRIVFTLDDSLLSSGVQLFTGAIQDLETRE